MRLIVQRLCQGSAPSSGSTAVGPVESDGQLSPSWRLRLLSKCADAMPRQQQMPSIRKLLVMNAALRHARAGFSQKGEPSIAWETWEYKEMFSVVSLHLL